MQCVYKPLKLTNDWKSLYILGLIGWKHNVSFTYMSVCNPWKDSDIPIYDVSIIKDNIYFICKCKLIQ